LKPLSHDVLSQETTVRRDAFRPGVETAYVPEIDGLRALAVVSVMIYHAAPKLLPSGLTGVDVFFVISG
jgi:peptidoglycan/LPS O-acetylase OafA/YrhL